MTNFPLTAKYLPGLRIRNEGGSYSDPYIKPVDLEAELAKGVQLYSDFCSDNWSSMSDPEYNNRCGLLIGIHEIKQESADDLLREISAAWGTQKYDSTLYGRISAYLQRRGEK